MAPRSSTLLPVRDGWFDSEEFRRRTDALRVARQWPAEQVPAYLGISSTLYYYYRGGERQPGLLTAHRLAAKLGCTVEDLTVSAGDTREPDNERHPLPARVPNL